MDTNTVKNVETLAAFLGPRDLRTLSPDALQEKYGIEQADVMVLFGGSILEGAAVLAEGMEQKLAKHYVIVGGAGHTTEALREQVRKLEPELECAGCSEAEIFNQYLEKRYGRRADFLETRSTNCGNNITYLLELLEKNQIKWDSMLLCQDATMQRRMEAGLRRQVPEATIINYAAYEAPVRINHGALAFTNENTGMWNMDRYLELLMGEIPRLRDDRQGYGPNGQGFIAHVDIPESVQKADEALRKELGLATRVANAAYAS